MQCFYNLSANCTVVLQTTASLHLCFLRPAALAYWQSGSQPVATKQQVSQHKCFHCGVPGHVKRVCRLKGRPVICHCCKQTGHKQKYCSQKSSLSGYFVLPKVNLCSNSQVCSVPVVNSVVSPFGGIAHANFVGNMPTSAAIQTIRSFTCFPPPPIPIRRSF